MASGRAQYRISCFIQDGLVKSKNKNFGVWADANVKQLARIYEEYRGVAYSLVDASHVLYFMQTVCDISSFDDTIDMTNHFIRCQFKDSIV
jgi:hypothetical protein